MLFKMSDDKKTIVEPSFEMAVSQPCSVNGEAKKIRSTKKYVLIGVIALLVTGLIITGVLVGIKIYTDSNLEILKYTLQENGLSQNVTVDNNNAITYHLSKGGLEAWILQDFDKGIQVTKQVYDGYTNCYVTALNRSTADDASSIPDTTPDTSQATSGQVIYKVMPDPIVDLTFLGSKAAAMCQNIPTYHAVPDCGEGDSSASLTNSTSAVGSRKKRTPAYCATCTAYRCQCICGCCGMVCADYTGHSTVCTWYYNSATNTYTCNFYFNTWYIIMTFPWPTCTYNGVRYLP